MCDEHVLQVGGLAADLGVEVQAAGGQAALVDDDLQQQPQQGVRRDKRAGRSQGGEASVMAGCGAQLHSPSPGLGSAPLPLACMV